MNALTRIIKWLAVSSILSFSVFANAATLKVRFTSLRSGDGHLAVSLFSEEQKASFPGNAENATQRRYLKLEGQTSLDVIFEDLPEGEYAIAVMHDEDSDTKFKTNFVGIPKEGFGFSNNPKVIFGAPGYKKASFNTKDVKDLEIKLSYFF